jgi:glycerol dehydrogenase-like iron-containing ADH family enzyme
MLDRRNWDARYGWGLLAAHGPRYNSYIAITSPSAWRAVERFLPHPPRCLEFHQGMGERYLEALLSRLPDAELVLAIGGGNALDVGKYAAWKLNKPLIMIPSIVSTGAVFQPLIAIRGANGWDMLNSVAPEYLLFDFDVIRSAPPRFNCAGMGECICFLGTIGSWRWWTDHNLGGPPWDQIAADATVSWVRERSSDFSRHLDENGQPKEAAIRIAAEINRERYDLRTFQLKVSHSLDHVFIMGFEWILGRELLHSEGVALGSLMNCYLYQWGFEETKQLLDSCQVHYRLRDIGCTWSEVRTVLEKINDLNDRLGLPKNWFHHRQLDETTLNCMMAAIES